MRTKWVSELPMPFAAVIAAAVALGGNQPVASAQTSAALAPRTACRGQSAVTAPAAVQVRAMRCLVNWARRHGGRARLRGNAELDRSSAMRAGDIRRCQDFSHTPCGQSFLTVFTVVHYITAAASVGENLAWGQGRLGSARTTMANWLASPEHRQILYTSQWRDLGVARVHGNLFGRSNVTVWVAQFGRRAGLLPLP
jgi:uncharacterized protein YkwD